MLTKARALSNIDVTFISLVDKGANQKTIIWKADGDKTSPAPAFQRVIDVLKTDEEKHLVYGIVYAPDEWDSHEDTASASEIEKAAHLFLKSARTQQVDKQHDLSADEGYVAESWIVREGDSLFKEVGAWAVAIKVENAETWEMVKSGEITGISLYGTANYEDIEKMDKTEEVAGNEQADSPLARMKKWLADKAEGIKKGFSENVNRSQLSDSVYAIWYALDDVLYDQSIPNKYEALISEAQKFIQHIESIKPMEKSDTSALEEQVAGLTKSVETLTSVVEGLVTKAEEPGPVEEPAKEAKEEVKKEEPVAKEAPAEETPSRKSEELTSLQERIDKLEKMSAGRQSVEKRPVEQEGEKVTGIPFF